MEIVRRLAAPCSASVLFAHVDDLSAYPVWMGLVHSVEPTADVDGVRAWDVELRARVGPLARSKRLRMCRTVCDPARRVVFERCEPDDRNHSPWILKAELSETSSAELDGDDVLTELEVTLCYGGGLWTGAVLQRVLDDQVTAGRDALLALVS